MGYSFMLKKARYTAHKKSYCAGGCQNGEPRLHDSIEESKYCDFLYALMRAGEIKGYRSQAQYDLVDCFGNCCGYMRVDFEIINTDGTKEIHEYKSKFFGDLMGYKQKKALFSWVYPDIKYITVGKEHITLKRNGA